MSDSLAEINGIKPNVYLADGDEKEVGSKTSNSKYKCKRALDHYYCTCPAWRNQKGVPTESRTCKHLKELLGDKYEAARLALKSTGTNDTGSSQKKAPVSKSKTPAKKRKKVDEEEDEEAAGDENEDEKPAKKTRKKATDTKPTSTRSARGKKKVEPEPEPEPKDEDVEEEEAAEVDTNDELAVIGGIKPKVYLADGDEREVGSKTSNSKYKCKRALGHYYCTCPAWRNQKGVPTESRTCKHLKELLGDKYEAARLALKDAGTDNAGSSQSKAPVSKSKTPSKKRKKVDEDEDEDDAEEEDEKPAKKTRKNAADTKPTSTRSARGKKTAEPEPGPESEPKEEDVEMEDSAEVDASDELAIIDGNKPKVYMKDGDTREVSSQSSSSKYNVKRTWDHYYCTCPAWRNQGGAPTNARTCKHLKELLGEKYEIARITLKNPEGAAAAAASSKPKSAGSAKKSVEVLLANKWDLETGADPTGWWISEKLDGVRTFYDGEGMYSRLGNPFTPPKWFLDKLPKDVTLDGELFGGRSKFQDTVSIVKTSGSPHWKNIAFHIFDIPSSASLPFEERMDKLKELFGSGGEFACPEVVIVEHEEAKDKDHVLEKLKEIEGLGGEGLMLRKPGSVYEPKRSSTLLKIKTFYDAEAKVTGYADGKGKHKGATGALICVMESGKTFNVGTGLSDKQRKNPPKIGAIIVYRFQELTRDGVPRFPSFIGEEIDKTEAKDAEIPEHRKGVTGGDD
ncbi:DNA ligase [Flagelloscypha sp. PMI_526]|nr:DNA ligase [Flagelloscypha sp. PMI_526]